MQLHTLLTPMMLKEGREEWANVKFRAEVMFHDYLE